MPPIQDRTRTEGHETLDPFEELVEHNLAPPPLDRCAVVCGVLGLMVLMTMLLIAVGVLDVYDWRPR